MKLFLADPFFQKAVSPRTQNNKHVWRKSKIQRQWDKYYIDKSKEMKAHMGQSIWCQPSCNDSVNALLEAMCFATQRFGPGFQHFGFMAVLSYGAVSSAHFFVTFLPASNTIIQSYMNHHESHPTVRNTLIYINDTTFEISLMISDFSKPFPTRRPSAFAPRLAPLFVRRVQPMPRGRGVDRFDDFEWLQTDAATAFLCVSCHVFSTWIVSTQNI